MSKHVCEGRVTLRRRRCVSSKEEENQSISLPSSSLTAFIDFELRSPFISGPIFTSFTISYVTISLKSPLELELNFSPFSPFSQLMGITPRQKVGQTAHLFQRDRHLCRLFLPPTKVSNFRSREREKGEESKTPVETFPKQVRKSALQRLQFSFQDILCSKCHMISN